MTTNDYTPLESLLLFQSLLKFGVEQQAFRQISDLLIKNDLVRNSGSYDAARLSPDRLHDLFLRLLRSGIPTTPDDIQDPSKSPNSKKRKLATAPSPSLAEAREQIEKLPAFVYHLYECYVKDAVAQVHKYDDQFGEAKRELEQQIQAAHESASSGKVEAQNGTATPDTLKDPKLLNGQASSQKSSSQSTDTPKQTPAPPTRHIAQENKTGPVPVAASTLPPASVTLPSPALKLPETSAGDSRIASKPKNGTQPRLQPATPQQQSPQLAQAAPSSQARPQHQQQYQQQPQPQAPQQVIHPAPRSGQQLPTSVQKPQAPAQQSPSPHPTQPYTAPQPPAPRHTAPLRPVSHPAAQKATPPLPPPSGPQLPTSQQPAVQHTGPQRPNLQPTGPQRPDHQQIGPPPVAQSPTPVLRHPQVSSPFGTPKPITPGPPPTLPAEVSKRPETTVKPKPQPPQQPQQLKWEPVVTTAPGGGPPRHHPHPQQPHAVAQSYKHSNLRTPPAMQSPTPGIASPQLQAPAPCGTSSHHPVLVAPSNVGSSVGPNVGQIAPPPPPHLQPLQQQSPVKAGDTSTRKLQGRPVPPTTQQQPGTPGQQFNPGYPQHPQTTRLPIPPPQPHIQTQATQSQVSAPAPVSAPAKPVGTTQSHPRPPRQGAHTQDLSVPPVAQSQLASQPESQRSYNSPYHSQSTRPVLPEHLSAQQSTPTPASRRIPLNNFPQTPISNIPTPVITGSGTRWKANPTPGTPRPDSSIARPMIEPLSPRVARAAPVMVRPENPANLPQKPVAVSSAKQSQNSEKPINKPVAEQVEQKRESPVQKLSRKDVPKTLNKLDTSAARVKRQPSRSTSKGRGRANTSSTKRQRSKSVASIVDELSPDATDAMTATVKEEVATPGIPDELEDTTADEGLSARAAQSTPSRMPPKRAKRKREDTPPAPPAPVRQSPPPPDVWWTRSFPKVSASALDQIGSHRHANMFANPVKAREAPGYRDIVLQPQDIKSIRASISAGNRAAVAAANALTGGDPGTSYVRLAISEDLVPPRGIINSAQLECELMHMFANAIMYNPDPDNGPGLVFRKQDQEQGDGDVLGYQVDENGVVKDTRAMSMEVEKLLSELRAAEKGRAPEPQGYQGAPLSISRLPSASVASASRGNTAAPEDREMQDELATDPETVNMGLNSNANTPAPNPPKRRRFAHSTATKG